MLRSLYKKVCEDAQDGSATDVLSNSALVFVLNRDFLPGLRVLCYSLCVHKTLLDLPVILITEDESIQDDPLVALIADRVRIITKDEIAAFQNISSRLVDGRLKLDWIPKYTYLKWLMFDEYGFERQIFLDADIVCLQPIDDLLMLNGADLLGGPVFTKELWAEEGQKIAQDLIDQRIVEFSSLDAPAGQRLNTGVLVMNKKLLSQSFRANLIAFSEKGEYSVELAALRSFISTLPDVRLQLISPLYNFNHGYLERVSLRERFALLSKIKLLHYAGAGGKPWEKAAPTNIAEMVWTAYAQEAGRIAVLTPLI